MSSFDAGRIVASAELDTTPFRQGLRLIKGEARDFADRKITATADVDTKGADRQLAGFRRQLDDVARTRAQANVSLDNAEATRKLVTFQERLEQLRLKVATARVDADTEQAKQRLDALDIQLRKVGLITARPKVTLDGVERANLQLDALALKMHAVSGGGAGVGGYGGVAGGGGGFLNRITQRGFFNPGGLGTAIAFGAPAAVPVAGAALGVGAGAFAAGGALLPGLLGFGAASKSSIDQVSKNVEALEKIEQKLKTTPATTSGTTTKANAEYTRLLKQQKDILASMDPAQRRAAKNVEALDDMWKRFQKDLQPHTFALLADGATIADKGLKLLLPSAQAMGAELDDLAKRASSALNAPFWHDFFGRFLPGEGARAADAFGTAVGKILTGGAHLVEDFAPLGHDFERGLVTLSSRFESWTEGQGPGKFVAFVEKEGPQVARTLGALADGVSGVSKGLLPIGQLELSAFTPLLKALGELGEQHPKELRDIGLAYLTIATGLRAISIVKGLAGVVSAARGIAGLRTGGAGTGGGRGSLGGVLGRGDSPANPLYVFVVDKAPGGVPHPSSGGVGSKIKTAAKDIAQYGPGAYAATTRIGGIAARGLALTAAIDPVVLASLAAGSDPGDSSGERVLPNLNPLLKRFAIRNGKVYANGQEITGRAAQAVLASGQKNPTNNQGLSNYTLDHDYVQYKGGTQLLPGAKDLIAEQSTLVKALQGVGDAATGTGKDFDALDASNTRMLRNMANESREILAEEARLRDLFSGLSNWLRAAQTAAENGGFVIGKSLTDGITIGIKQGEDKVNLESVKIVKGALHAQRLTAQLGSPSKITTQYGRWIAEGLAVGFTGYSADLLKGFSQGTQVALDKIGLQVNSAADKLRSDLQARTQLSSSIQSSLLGSADIGQLTLSDTGTSIRGNNNYLLGQFTALDKDTRLLRARHLNSTYLQQIANAGPVQGLNIARDILSGREGSIASLNTQATALSKYAGSIGSTIAGATYGGTISRDGHDIVQAIYRLMNADTRLSPHTMADFERAVETALRRAFPTLNLSELGKRQAGRISARISG